MKDETAIVFRGEKNAEIISWMSQLFGLDLKTATDIYYNSETANLIEEGIADLHCRSEKYLATLVMDEFKGKS